ncbi:4-methylaminobutanoate oxidase (formaldehyde-forming) [compost metagenome]
MVTPVLRPNLVWSALKETLGLHYAMPWPNRELETARPFRRSPLYAQLREAGAGFGSKMGWERPNFFAPAGESPAIDRTGCREAAPNTAPAGKAWHCST